MKKEVVLNGVIVGEVEATGDDAKDAQTVQDFLKSKGLFRETSSNDVMYAQACAFTQVANDIYRKDLKVSPYKGISTGPFVVNAVFSIELYLKTMHDAFGQNVRGHHLYNLYKGLPRGAKEHYLAAASEVRLHYNLEEDTDIFTCLKALSNAFEQWRYLYEHDRLGTELQSVRYALRVSYEACCRVRESQKKT